MKKQNGFTLVELVVVMLIVGILTTMATNTYSSYTIKSNRVEAKNMLYEIMSRQERYMSENNTYVTDLSLLGYADETIDTDNGFYTIDAAANDNGIGDGVILTATAKGKQEEDTKCGNLILNSNGRKTTSTSSSDCW